MKSFYWLIEDALAGCGRPGGMGARMNRRGVAPAPGETAEALDADLAWLRGQGIGALLTLTETPLPAEALARHGFEALHLPVDDLTAPSPAQFDRALAFIDRQRAQGRSVATHCLMGQGRTGTVLAAYRIRGGLSVEAALRELRAICPGAVGADGQVQALHAFARRRDWIV